MEIFVIYLHACLFSCSTTPNSTIPLFSLFFECDVFSKHYISNKRFFSNLDEVLKILNMFYKQPAVKNISEENGLDSR